MSLALRPEPRQATDGARFGSARRLVSSASDGAFLNAKSFLSTYPTVTLAPNILSVGGPYEGLHPDRPRSQIPCNGAALNQPVHMAVEFAVAEFPNRRG